MYNMTWCKNYWKRNNYMQGLPSVPLGFKKWNIWVILYIMKVSKWTLKIKAMMEWPIPKTLKNLRGF
jgi:hypothetical protein